MHEYIDKYIEMPTYEYIDNSIELSTYEYIDNSIALPVVLATGSHGQHYST